MPDFVTHLGNLVKEQEKPGSIYHEKDTLINRVNQQRSSADQKDMGLLARVLDEIPYHDPDKNKELYEKYKTLVLEAKLQSSAKEDKERSPIHSDYLPKIDAFIHELYVDACKS